MTDEDGMFMRVRWFGDSWGSHVNDDCERVDVPIQTKCLECHQIIGERDRGIVTACSPNIWGHWFLKDGEFEHSVCSYHLSCWLRVVLGEEIAGEILTRMKGGIARKRGDVLPVGDEFSSIALDEEEVVPGRGWGKDL